MASVQASLVANLLPSLLASTVTPSISTAIAASSTGQLLVAPSNYTLETPHNHDGSDGGYEHEWSSLIGIITALCGNVLISLALNIQRYAHIRIGREYEQDKNGNGSNGTHIGARGRSRDRYRDSEQDGFDSYRDDASDTTERQNSGFGSRDTSADGKDGADGHRKSYLKSPYWWAGIVLMVVGEMGNFMAYGFAPASIVSPLGVVALISNCIIAPCLLKEQFRKRDLWGVLISVAGAVVVVLSAKSSEEQIGPHEIWVNITRWEFELYLGLTTALIVVLMWASHQYGSRSILIDVGLVALFGKSSSCIFSRRASIDCVFLLTSTNRWIHSPFYEGCLLTSFWHLVARYHISDYVPACLRPCIQRLDASSLYQSCSATF